MQVMMVTGGAGFIGSAVVRYLIAHTQITVVNVDKLTYGGNLASLATVSTHPRYRFEHADIGDEQAMSRVLAEYHPDAVMHLAAESHVDRSIEGPTAFIQTNVVGTCILLEAVRGYWHELSTARQQAFRFHHISTDEVYGSLGAQGQFTESSRYAPNSPYAASKAASDHLVRAWYHTYGLPVVITNCSNNYGPYQYPEKLIPLMILNALEGKPLPVYGDGRQVRDWLYVEDHVQALMTVLTRGSVGEVYNIGGYSERSNLEVVQTICAILEDLKPEHPPGVRRYADLIAHVTDRPGHDRRYAIDASKLQRDLDWSPREHFESGLRKTVQWYLDNRSWCQQAQAGHYQRERLGLLNKK